MKAITLWQPWASLMVLGVKKIETRSWPTRYRGPLAIHAAKRIFIPDSDEFRYFMGLYIIDPKILPLGAMLGICQQVDCIQVPDSSSKGVPGLTNTERAFGDYTPGRYAWITTGMKAFDSPIPCSGKQGLWNWEGVAA